MLSIGHQGDSAVAISVNGTSTSPAVGNSSASLSKQGLLHGLVIKIVSPPRGQQVPTGGNLTVSGVSSDNPSTNCQVSLLLNDMKPYQKTTPIGKSNPGEENYSSWKYIINSKYGTIKAGSNKITSKLTCNTPSQPSGISKWYSINITGTREKVVAPGHSVAKLPVRNIQNQSNTSLLVAPGHSVAKLPVRNIQNQSNTSLLVAPGHSVAKLPVRNIQNQSNTSLLHADLNRTSPVQLTASTYKPIQPTSIASKTNSSVSVPRTLVAFLDVSKDPIAPGQKQTIKVIVSDGTTNARIAGAKVTTDVQPTSSSFLERHFVGFTGPDGKISKSWKMTDDGKSESNYNIFSKVSAFGYEDKIISATFRAASPQDTVNNISNRVDDLSNKIIDEVKKGFDQNALIPKLPIPFN
jgi:hypothetical protein